MVAPVDERDPAGSPSQRVHGGDPAEAAPHHEDMRHGLTFRYCIRAWMAAHWQPAVERQPSRSLRCQQQQQQRDFEPVRHLTGEENWRRQHAQEHCHRAGRQAEQQRPAQQEQPPEGAGAARRLRGSRPCGKAGPAGDRQCEIAVRPKRQCEIAESVAQSIKPAGGPQCRNRHPCEPAPQREIERQRSRATNEQPEQENCLRSGQVYPARS